jgi:hypothetical protein
MGVLADPAGWFSLEIPEGWAHQEDDGVAILRHPAGVGQAFVAVARHVGGRQRRFGRAEFLRRFLRSVGVTVETSSISLEQGEPLHIYSYGHEIRGVFWRHWSVTDDETAVLISYTCASPDADIELDEIGDMVRSVRLRGSPVRH